MGETIAEKILRDKVGKKVTPGEIVTAKVDLVLANDITAPLATERFEEMGSKEVYNPEKVVFVLDHFVPSRNMRSAEVCRALRDFAQKHMLRHFFDVATGIEHALLPEEGLVLPQDLVVGGDSHTCTYGALGALAVGVGSTDVAAAMATGEVWLRVPESMKIIYSEGLVGWTSAKDLILYTIGDIGVSGALYRVMEFSGEAVKGLSMDGRFTVCNMAVEAGAKTGMMEPDQKTFDYLEGRAKRPYGTCRSDHDAHYAEVVEYDVRDVGPQVALPHLPSNVKPVEEVSDVLIDQGVIGSCTNGRIEDLRAASKVLEDRKVHSGVRLLVFPATQRTYLQAIQEGLIEVIVRAGGIVNPPSCGPCLGGHLGVLAEGERAVSTTNRNFVGRMGHPRSEVYLASPAVVAASAVLGGIAHPKEVVQR